MKYLHNFFANFIQNALLIQDEIANLKYDFTIFTSTFQ